MPETGIKCTTCEGMALSNHQAIRKIASAAKPSPTPESNRFGRGGGRVQVPLSRARFTAADRARCAINAGNRHQMHNVRGEASERLEDYRAAISLTWPKARGLSSGAQPYAAEGSTLGSGVPHCSATSRATLDMKVKSNGLS